MKKFFDIDGSQGEGGGQILRTALSLSVLTNTPIRLQNIRAGRSKPGLMRQHLVCVEAAAAVSAAEVTGADLGSTELCFVPQSLQGGNYHFAIGSAGSSCLVLQTLLPILLTAKQNSRVTITGGTHNMMAPSTTYLQRCFLPILHKMGAQVTLTLEEYGLFPAGGGRLVMHVLKQRSDSTEPVLKQPSDSTDSMPAQQIKPISLLERGELLHYGAEAIVAAVPDHVAERELSTIRGYFKTKPENLQAINAGRLTGPGNVLSLWAEFAHSTAMVTAYGERRRTAEQVATEACAELAQFLTTSAAVDEHLSDQLLLPLYLAGGGEFSCAQASGHLTTNIDTINAFAKLHGGTKLAMREDHKRIVVYAENTDPFIN